MTRHKQESTDRISGDKEYYQPPQFLVDWLEDGDGRAAYFSKVDPVLSAPTISKIKFGRIPITFELAVRMERAQKVTMHPLKAIDLMTFERDRELYRYVTGQEPAPEQVKIVRKPTGPRRKDSAVNAGA